MMIRKKVIDEIGALDETFLCMVRILIYLIELRKLDTTIIIFLNLISYNIRVKAQKKVP